ncbi:MAG: DNA translocase FtsK [Dehalococcoidales bacterium]|nr:DNA translocase FtsK [Dehalococcoidales bacterium]
MSKKKGKSKQSNEWGWLRHWRLILLVVIIALLFWQWNNLVWWVTGVINNTLWLFGWGLVFIAVAIGTIVVMIWRRELSFVIHHWYQFLGGIAFALAIWGILAYFPGRGVLERVGLGGSIGLGIIGNTSIGILRIAGLVLIGFILVAPRVCFHTIPEAIAGFFSRLRLKFKRGPAVKPTPQRKLTVPSFPAATEPSEVKPKVESEAETDRKVEALAHAATSGATPTLQDLKQVAQDVWKKYGESTDLVIVDGWKLPPVDILERSPEIQFSQADNVQRAKLIEEALASYGVEAKVVQINAGPTVTQFGVEPGWDRKMKEVKEKDKDGSVQVRMEEISKTRVKVERISSLANDLALALAAPTIRIEAPVPGKAIVGIEVPNTISTVVSLRGVIETSVFQKTQAKSRLSLALGKGAGGEAVAADLGKMPHLLIAGATGSGKTVCLNTVICCLLLNNTPFDVQFVMIDPKRVELTSFNSIPHLATPVIVDADKALNALRWLSQEMDRRYQKLASVSARNIEGYNKNRQGDQKMSYLVLIIDELADLMMLGGDEVERILCRLAQLSRAVGIHLVVATQRPSVDVVTGLIKANFPTRISFAVTSQVDSRTILDGAGAEKLLGKGDMLYMPTEAGKPKRLQGCYVSDPEIERLVYFWGGQRRGEVTSLNIEGLASYQATSLRADLPEDSLLETARQLAKEHPQISASFLQRKLRIGYPRAARLMEQLEEAGVKREEGDGEKQSS